MPQEGIQTPFFYAIVTNDRGKGDGEDPRKEVAEKAAENKPGEGVASYIVESQRTLRFALQEDKA